MMQKKPEEWRKPSHMVLIWEYSVRAIQWVPTWQGLDGFQISVSLCLDQISLSIERVNTFESLARTYNLTTAGKDLKYSNIWYIPEEGFLYQSNISQNMS